MEYAILFTGLFLIGLGFLVKRYPILIAGYNTMSAKEKEKVDVKGLSAFMCWSLVAMGLSLIGAYYFCVWMEWWTVASWVTVFVPLLFLPYVVG